jgi:uncharacterized protein (DUF1800 family)
MSFESRAGAIATNRFGLGARPGDIASVGSDPRGWLKAQLRGAPPVLHGSALPSSTTVLATAIDLRKNRDAADAMKIREYFRPLYIEEARARFDSAVATERPFVERLTQFWSNHFAVSVDKIAVLGVAGAMEREAIRPHVLGRFADLLKAVEQHPAMLLYLDNHLSAGPHSIAAEFVAARGDAARKLGLNENLAREILELHTLGVDGGYSQTDVTTFASVLSGWSVGGPIRGGNAGRPRGLGKSFGNRADGADKPGEFVFREAFHEPGTQRLLGRSYSQSGVRQGEAVLEDLAQSPATAHHLATKLVRHFVADDPPPAAVAHVAKVFHDSNGDLAKVYAALVDLPDAWSAELPKFKTPADYIYSAYRALTVPVPEDQRALAGFEVLGQRSFQPGSPAGWPDRSDDWDGSSAVLKRIEWADAVGQRLGSQRDAAATADAALGATLSAGTRQAIARAASGAQALTLLLASPEFMRR